MISSPTIKALLAAALEATKCAQRKIWLRSGTYTWRDCLESVLPPPVLYRGYDHVSTLNVGNGPAALKGYAIASHGNGTYEYGSALLRTGG